MTAGPTGTSADQQVTCGLVIVRMIELGGRRRLASPGVEFSWQLVADQYELDGPFGIWLAHESLSVLVDEMLVETLGFLWDVYACANEDTLDEGAKDLKRQLLARFPEP